MDRDPKKVLIGIAIGNGSTRWETSFALIRLLASQIKGYEFTIIPGGGCDVCHARNLMMHYWRTRTDCGALHWIDSDVRFGPEHLMKLYSWLDRVPYVAGLYPLKDTHLRWSYNGWSRESKKHSGLWEVQEVCTGFTAMRWDLQEQLIAAHQDQAYVIEDSEYRGETGYELCAMGVVNRRRVPEDFYLSQRIRALGHEIYADPQIQVGHVKDVDLLKFFTEGKEKKQFNVPAR